LDSAYILPRLRTALPPPLRLIFMVVLAVGLAGVSPAAYANDDEKPPAPRATVIIGAASVVLEVTNNMLYAYVDRIEDDTRVEGAELGIEAIDRTAIPTRQTPLAMTRLSEGAFIGPLNRSGQKQGTFFISLRSSAASGEASATIVYNDLLAPDATDGMSTTRKLTIASVSMAAAAAATVLGMLCWRLADQRGRGAGDPV
jgi:hypothetical protein